MIFQVCFLEDKSGEWSLKRPKEIWKLIYLKIAYWRIALICIKPRINSNMDRFQCVVWKNVFLLLWKFPSQVLCCIGQVWLGLIAGTEKKEKYRNFLWATSWVQMKHSCCTGMDAGLSVSLSLSISYHSLTTSYHTVLKQHFSILSSSSF